MTYTNRNIFSVTKESQLLTPPLPSPFGETWHLSERSVPENKQLALAVKSLPECVTMVTYLVLNNTVC